MKRTILILLALAAILTAAPVENVISFQGKLVEGGAPVDGTRNIVFRIYDTDAGGVHLWEESHLGVSVVGGLFNVELGGSVNFAGAGVSFDEQYWIGISVGGGAEITPRYKLTSSSYSMAPWTIDADNIYRETGNVGIGTNSPVYKLHVSAEGGGTAVYGFTDALFIDNFGIIGAQDVSTCWGGLGGYTVEGNDVGVYGVQGTGDYAGYFDGGVFVDGQITISGGSPGAGKVLTSNASGLATWQTPAGGSNWTLSSGNVYRTTGNVGIGTSSPTNKLHVVGNTLIDGTLKTGNHTSSAVPVAYGSIASDGSISSGTSNVLSCVWSGTYERYEITIDGESYYGPTYPTVVTTTGSSPAIARTGSVSSKLLVFIYNLSGDQIQTAFSFVIYKP